MIERIVQTSTAQISKAVSDFTVGLAKLVEKDRIEDAICAGSGTLATIGGVYGVLTAAHVIDGLPKAGEVGIVLHREMTFQKQVMKMENTERITVRGELFGQDGPDLGFLRIPQENLGWLKATSTFFNLTQRREEHRAGLAPASIHVDAVIGMIDEFTKDVPTGRPKRRKGIFRTFLQWRNHRN